MSGFGVGLWIKEQWLFATLIILHERSTITQTIMQRSPNTCCIFSKEFDWLEELL